MKGRVGTNQKIDRSWLLPIGVVSAALLLAVALAFGPIVASESGAEKRARLVPREGKVAFGVQLDWAHDSPTAYARRLGRPPAIVGDYVGFPFSGATRAVLRDRAEAVAGVGATYMLNVMPNKGLASIRRRTVEDLTATVSELTQKANVMVRFAHEMNGPWYAWGQQPQRYVRAFRQVSTSLHKGAPDAAVVWAPNDGAEYPFGRWKYAARTGSASYRALDTNSDGRIDGADDPYGPFYPGDRYVDFVGLTLYHFGLEWPWDRNEVPPRNKVAGTILGRYPPGLDDSVRDFHARFAAGRAKPMLIAETGSLYLPGRPGKSEAAVKSAWWRQMFDPSLPRQLPMLRGILWFEYLKWEEGARAKADWRLTHRPEIRDSFRRAMPPWFQFGDPDDAGP